MEILKIIPTLLSIILMSAVVLLLILSPIITLIVVICLRNKSPNRTGQMFPYASFGARFMADCADLVLALIIAAPFWFLIDNLIFHKDIYVLLGERNDTGISNIILILIILFNMTYLVGKYGQSWGRKYKKIKVVNYVGNPIGFWRAFFRNLLAGSISASFLGFGFWWILWDKEKQSWHDKIMKTYVIYMDK